MANITINLDVETFIDSEITAAVAAHNLAYNHSHIATVYGWGNHASAGYQLASNLSNDISTDAASTTKYPSVAAIKTYADGLVTGLLDDRGNFTPSTDDYPTTGGSGTGGAILKGDIWYFPVDGTIDGVPVYAGGSVRALADTPGQTATNWDIMSSNLGYVPENVANKVTSISGASTDTQYPTAKLLYDQLALKQAAATNLTSLSALTFASASFVKMTGANTFSLDTNTYLTAEADTLATVTGRGATTATACTFSTSLTTPLLIGGIETTSDLVLQTTSGVGATGADMHFLVGNNGATEAMTILNNGNVGIGTASPTSPAGFAPVLEITGTAPALVLTDNSGGNHSWSFGAQNGYLYFSKEGTGRAQFDASGNFQIDGTISIDGAGNSYILGNVGIGTASPTAVLHIKAGTAAASTAPLKLTAGTNLTTPEAGAIEFDGTNLYFTDSGGTRRTIAVV